MMVDLALLQLVSYIAGALGVCVAAAYYVANLRLGERNRKTQLSTSIMERLGTKEWQKDFLQLAYYEWEDLDDFMKKYDSTVNPESHAQRWTVWSTYDSLGYLLRERLVDREVLFNSMGVWSIMIWGKFKPVIDLYRRRELGPRWMENFEYLAGEMWVIAKSHGTASPGFKDGLVVDSYRDVFEPSAVST